MIKYQQEKKPQIIKLHGIFYCCLLHLLLWFFSVSLIPHSSHSSCMYQGTTSLLMLLLPCYTVCLIYILWKSVIYHQHVFCYIQPRCINDSHIMISSVVFFIFLYNHTVSLMNNNGWACDDFDYYFLISMLILFDWFDLSCVWEVLGELISILMSMN